MKNAVQGYIAYRTIGPYDAYQASLAGRDGKAAWDIGVRIGKIYEKSLVSQGIPAAKAMEMGEVDPEIRRG